MVEFLPSGIRRTREALIENKKRNMMITIYGLYGDFEGELIEISSILRREYGYIDCKLVSQRTYPQSMEDEERFIAEKSFYFLGKSNVVVFIFFCDKRNKNKISHAESPASELTYLIDKISDKIGCCLVLREKGCPMSPVVFGHLKGAEIMYEIIEFVNMVDIAKFIKTKFMTFLEEKYYEIG